MLVLRSLEISAKLRFMGGKTETSKIAERTSAVNKKTEKKTVEKKTAAKTEKTFIKAKKPVAGIDETGTFRAWDNAKTKAKPKKTEEKTSAKRGITVEQTAKALAAASAFALFLITNRSLNYYIKAYV